MFIGHLPAAYLAFRALAPRHWTGPVLAAVLVGSVIPDIDMLWFYLADSSHPHHQFITHRPIVWIALAIIGLALRKPWILAVGMAAVFHCMLDTIAGAIAWGWPLSGKTLTLVHVPATRSHWILSFLTHWTFLVEIAITVVAAVVWLMWPAKRPAAD